MLQVKVLGCGSSTGVPQIGCKCCVCTSTNPKNKRTRASILLQDLATAQNVLVDAGPDIRTQILNNNINNIEAVIITHDHADHINGLDDLKSFAFKHSNKKLPLFAPVNVIKSLKTRMPYLFEQINKIYKPVFSTHVIDYYDNLSLCGLDIQFLKQQHGDIDSLGIKVADFAYSTDVKYFEPKAYNVLQSVKTWLIDCQKYHFSPTHLNYEYTLKNIEKIGPQKAFLTHLAHDLGYEEMCEILPQTVRPAYDGLEIKI